MALGTPALSSSSSGTQASNITQVGGTAISLGQKVMASSLPVVIASDQSGIAVTGTFWQATQPVSGTVTANAGTGTFNIQSNASINIAQVGGASFALGQQLAAASLPIVLTAAQLTTLTPPSNTGYALDASLTTIDTDLKSNITLHAGTNTIGSVKVTDGTNTQTFMSTTTTSKFGADINVLSILGTAPTTAGKLDVKAADGDVFVRSNAASTFPVTASIAAAQTLATVTNVTQLNGIGPTFNSTTFTGKEGLDVNILGTLGTAFSTAGKVDVLLNAETTKVIGTINIAASQTVGLAAGTNNIGVVDIADTSGNKFTSNSNTFTSKFAQDINLLGTLGTAFSTAGKIDITAIPAGTNLIGSIEVSDGTNVVNTTTHPAVVSEMPTASTGWSFNYQSALNATKAQIKATAGIFGGYVMLYNPNTAVTFIQVFNKASANVTVGTTAPDFVIPLPGVATASATGSAANVEFSVGIVMSTGITVAATTTATGSTNPANAIMATFLYT